MIVLCWRLSAVPAASIANCRGTSTAKLRSCAIGSSMSLIEGLQSSQLFFVSFCTILGMMVGSFLNVVIYRLPKMLERNWRRNYAELRDEPSEALAPYNILI